MSKTFWVASEFWYESWQDALECEGMVSVEAWNSEQAVLEHAEQLDRDESDVLESDGVEIWVCPEGRPDEAQTFIVTAELEPEYSAWEDKGSAKA